MNKKLLIEISILLVVLLLVFTHKVEAAFLVVDEQGNLVWQVLSKGSDDRSDDSGDKSGSSGSVGGPAPATKVENGNGDDEDEARKERKSEFRVEVKTREDSPERETKKEVRVRTEDGRIKLRVGTASGETEMDVSELREDIVRVRERTEEGEIRIRARAGRLEIRQKGVSALTNFPISVNPETNELTITTPAGTRVVTVLPAVAVQNILASNIIDRILAPSEEREATEAAELEEEEEEGEVNFSGVIEIAGPNWVIGGRRVSVNNLTELDEGLTAGVLAKVEGTLGADGTILAWEIETQEEVSVVERNGQLTFKIRGVKNLRFLNIFPVQAPVEAFVSTQTGEVLLVNRPFFLNLFGFLFSQ